MATAQEIMFGAALKVPLDECGWLALADSLEEMDRQEDAENVRRIFAGLRPILAARELLRERGLVEPQCLRVHSNGDWGWSIYHALPGHPTPGNARRGCTHPADLDLIGRRAADTQGMWPAMRRLLASGRARLQNDSDLAGVVLTALVRSLGMAAANIGHRADGDEVFFVDFERK